MTQPSSKVWATQVQPVVREYISAFLNEEIKPLRDDVAALRSALLSIRESGQSDVGQLTARVNDIEDLLKMSTSRIAKLAQLASED
jgi:hypothetical protein